MTAKPGIIQQLRLRHRSSREASHNCVKGANTQSERQQRYGNDLAGSSRCNLFQMPAEGSAVEPESETGNLMKDILVAELCLAFELDMGSLPGPMDLIRCF